MTDLPGGKNRERAEPDWPAVIVCGGFQTGVVLMRDLIRRGVRSYAIDFNPIQPCFKSVYGKSFLCPNPDFEPQAWVDFLLKVGREVGGKPVLIPSADQFVTAISEHAAALSDHFTFLPGSVAVQAMLATKKRQYGIAFEHGLPVPSTRFVRSAAEVEEFASQARFPCLMKPSHFREWERFEPGHPLLGEKIALADTPAQLVEQYRLAAVLTPEVVVQEIIQGPDSAKMVYLSCYGVGSKRLGACLVKQLRTMPMGFGSASVVERVDDPATDRVCDHFLQSVGYRGICELEIKKDVRDGQVKLIEVNPRYSVTADAATYQGIELGWLHYLDLIGQPVEPVQPTRNTRHIVLQRDFACVRGYRSQGQLPWSEFFAAYRPPVAFFDFDFKDRKVTWDTVVDLTKTVIGPTVRKVIPRRKRVN